MSAGRGLGDWLAGWLDARTRFKTVKHVLLDEEVPAGTGWVFTLGSVLLALIGVQLLTGAFLTLYYAPTPDHAYESVRFISSTASGRLVRGLHHFGASFLVVFLVLHLLRVVILGSYKAPRELTWLSGLALLGLVLAFALTGYLLPWDQRAYWATVVTINIARLEPVAGELIAAVMQGGSTIGALTLTRWYSAHVIFLPALLVLLIVAHIVLMRLQGSSGPVRPRPGRGFAFYPYQAFRDTVVVTVVLVAVTALALSGMPPLEGPADPTDANYIPRPEWYFLGLFQLLKYFPGQWEVVGAIVIPGLVALFLALLPWLDRGPQRASAAAAAHHDRRRRRRLRGRDVDDAGLARSTDLGAGRPVVDARGGRPHARGNGQLRQVPQRNRDGGSARDAARRPRHRLDRRARLRSGDDCAGAARGAVGAKRARGGGDRRLPAAGQSPPLSRVSAEHRDRRDGMGALLRWLPHHRRRRRQGRPGVVEGRRESTTSRP